VPDIVCANKNPGSDNASAIANDPFVPTRKRFKPLFRT